MEWHGDIYTIIGLLSRFLFTPALEGRAWGWVSAEGTDVAQDRVKQAPAPSRAICAIHPALEGGE
jgi:hypothetical protein